MSLINECKDGVVPRVRLMETYRGCLGTAPVICTLDFVWSSVVSVT